MQVGFYGKQEMARRNKNELHTRYFSGRSILLTPSDLSLVQCPDDKNQHTVWDIQVPGLGIRVANKGRKTFVLKKTFTRAGNRKDYKVNLGSCLTMSLDEARQAALEIIKNVEESGLTPVEQQQQKALLEQQAKEKIEAESRAKEEKLAHQKNYTLGTLCMAYANHLEAQGKVSHKSVRSSLNLHVIKEHPEIAKLPANEVKRSDIAKILEKMIEKGVKAGVSRTRSYLVTAYNLAISVDGDVTARRFFNGFNVGINPAHQTASRPLRRLCGVGNRVLDEDEIRLFFKEACFIKPGPVRDVLLMNFFLGGQRTMQLLRVKREDLDLRAGLVTLLDPKGNRDRPRLHVLPLVGHGLRYAKYLDEKAYLNGTEYLFASEILREQHVASDLVSRVAAEISNRLINEKLIRRSFTKADLRRTVETVLARNKVPMEVRGQLQSHGLSGVQIRHYDRHDYVDEKREALEIWQNIYMSELCPLLG